MKRFFGVTLAAASFFYAASVHAADFNIEGDFRVRGLYSDNLSDANDAVDDQEAFADGRYRVKTTASAGMTRAVLVLDFFNSFNDPNNSLRCPGTNGFTDPTTGATDTSAAANACATGNYRFGTINFGNAYNVVGVRQAYLRIDMDRIQFALGRKPWKLGHGLILEDIADAVATKFNLGPASVILADVRLFDTHSETSGVVTPTSTGGDTDLYIFKAGMHHGEEHALGFFAAYMNDRDNRFIAPELAKGTLVLPGVPLGLNPLIGGSPGDSDLLTLGLTADGTVGPMIGRFEVDFLTGTLERAGFSDIDLEGFNLLIGAGMPVGPASVGIDFLFTSGQEVGDPDVNVNGLSGNYVLGNILLNDDVNSDRDGQCASVPDANGTAFGGRVGSGSPGCLGGFGITAIKLTAALPMSESSHTELALIYAETQEKPNVLQVPGDDDLGFEIDLNHLHRLDDNLSVSVNLGWLIAGDAWKTLGDTLILDDGPGGTFLPIGVNQNGGDDDQLKGVISVNYTF